MDSFVHCLRCHRGLSDPNSVRRGFGPICWTKVNVKRNEVEKVDSPTITDWKLAEGTRNKLFHKIADLEYPDNKCHCGADITKGVLCSYDHDGGVEAAGYGEKQWFFLHCIKCGYDYALWKLHVPMNDLGDKIEKLNCGCGAIFYAPLVDEIINCPDCGRLIRDRE